MNVAFLLKQYFQDKKDVSIDVFDAHTLNDVYQQVLRTLTSHFEIEVSVLQALSYCFYEILDNVHIHSGKPLGTAMTHFDSKEEVLRILVADDGMGIRQSLAENEKYQNITEAEAVKMCLEDSVTDGKGMGFGLYATSRLIKNIGLQFILHSGNHKLIYKDGNTEIVENGLWQGTIVYMEIRTSLFLYALALHFLKCWIRSPKLNLSTSSMFLTFLYMEIFFLRGSFSKRILLRSIVFSSIWQTTPHAFAMKTI